MRHSFCVEKLTFPVEYLFLNWKHLNKSKDNGGGKYFVFSPLKMFKLNFLVFVLIFIGLINGEPTTNRPVPSMDLDENNFKEVLENNSLVFVKFYTTW